MKRTTKAPQIRQAIREGKDLKEIAKELNVSLNRVYTVRWEMRKKAAKRVAMTKREAELAKKLAVPLEVYAKEKLRMQQAKAAPKASPEIEAYQNDLSHIESQINRLSVTAAYFRMRIDQMQQSKNGRV